ncbi:hypothetical protein D3C71_1873410 [compost metagenome]
MDKWQEQQDELREMKAEVKQAAAAPVSLMKGIDPKDLEDIIVKLETNVRQLKDKLPRSEGYL